MDVVASLSRDSKIGPVRVNHKMSTTGDGTRKQGDERLRRGLKEGPLKMYPYIYNILCVWRRWR